MVARRLIRLSSVFLLVSLSCQFIQPMMPFPAAESGALLNEVLFLPAQGGSAFIELKSPGQRVSLNGLYLMNEQGDSFALPDGVKALASDQFLLILFDGTNLVEDQTIHASQTGFLNPESGFVELYASDGALLDRVAWGADQPASVKLTRGGMVFDLEPGTSIGRFPRSVQLDPLEWTVFSTAQATPGAANPQPGVEVMIPLNGAVIKQTSFELSWYPAPGAARYQVQAAVDESFSTLTIDQSTDVPSLNVELMPGTYYWRVQAVPENGKPAGFSPAQILTVNPDFSGLHLAKPASQTTLAVPFISQHKDTGMLLLESKNESGAHAWDVDHQELDRGDPADNTNCALASIAMINAYLGGDLSQDRIGYEVFKDFWDGPEYDLNYGNGLYDFQTTQALAFALDAEPEFRPEPDSLDEFWETVQWEVDAGRPILAAQKPGHAFVITGYYEDNSTRYVFINDPWSGMYAVDIARVPWKHYWLISPDSIPVLNDPEIGVDSDGDGIVDFDEANRFGTNPNDTDTDKDNVKDKEDLRASIFDEHFGYAIFGSLIGRDYDDDGVVMELDEDSDDGGCFDGMEDFDLDGKFKQPETWNFDDGDDACFFGTDELVLDATKTWDDGSSHHQRIRTYATFSLRAVENGKLEGLAKITYTHTGEFSNSECSGTHTIGTGFFQAILNGEFQKLPDDSTLVSFRATPAQGEPYYVQWNTPCPVDDEQWQGWSWPGQSGTMKDGVYDYYADMSSSLIGESGEFWQKVHMEQGQGQ